MTPHTDKDTDWLDDLLYRFANYIKRHEKTGLGHPMDNQSAIKQAITAHITKAVASAIPKRREQLIDMAGRLYEPEWLQGYNQAINEIRSALKLDDKEE